MTKLRNAVLAGVLVAGIGGAGVLTAAPAFAAQVATPGGTLISATGTAGQDLDVAMTGTAWTLSEPLGAVHIELGLPAGTVWQNSFNGVPGTERIPGNPAQGYTTSIDGLTYTIYPQGTTGIWTLQINTPGLVPTMTEVKIPTLKLGQVTPTALQTQLTFDLRQTTDEIKPSATFTWTEDQPDTPVIAPAIGGAAAIAGLGLSGIVFLRRRNAEQA
ncbi:hypothetical protein ABIC47_003519 [Leifsonia sp. 563]|uniref:peptide ABC transporter substrate-binding protein n=1 Tax=Leifsonia sp. 563 TaxID=3156412 RepID=UPI00339B80EE